MKRARTRATRAPKMTPARWQKMNDQVERFNRLHPVGSEVTFTNDLGRVMTACVRHQASILSGHTPVMWLEGIPGCFLLSRVID